MLLGEREGRLTLCGWKHAGYISSKRSDITSEFGEEAEVCTAVSVAVDVTVEFIANNAKRK